MRSINNHAQVCLVIYTWLFIIIRNALFPKQVSSWYAGVYDPSKTVSLPFTAAYFIKTMKIFANKQAHHERSSLRNAIFDWMRCEIPDIFTALVFGGVQAFDSHLIG